MPGGETGGVGNFWYSFDYGMVHFVALNGETDFPNSPEYPFEADLTGNETHPTEAQTYITDSGPFGAVDGSYSKVESYQQYKWLAKDLASVDRTKTPWVIAMSHRPMYSSETLSYQKYIRNAFEALLLENEVDMYLAGYFAPLSPPAPFPLLPLPLLPLPLLPYPSLPFHIINKLCAKLSVAC